MAVYIISLSTATTDAAEWRDNYLAEATPALAKHGARVVGVCKPENFERGNDWERAALIEFPSVEAAHAFHADPDYKNAMNLRIANTNGEMYLLSIDS